MKSSVNHQRRKLIGARCTWLHAAALRPSSVALAAAVLSSRSSPGAPGLDRHLSPFHFLLSSAIALALTANIASSLATYPHTLSYFNELVGGPLNGAEHLLGANIDWGQDGLFLKRWHDTRPEVQPLHVFSLGLTDSAHFRIAFAPAYPNVQQVPDASSEAHRVPHAPSPRFYVLSVNELHGYRYNMALRYTYDSFNAFSPAAYIGYSFRVYDCTRKQEQRISQGAFPSPALPTQQGQSPQQFR